MFDDKEIRSVFDDREIITHLMKYEVMLSTIQDRQLNLETQLNTIKDIVRDVQSLALEQRELKVLHNGTTEDMRELEDRVAVLEKDLYNQSKDKNQLWVVSAVGILSSVIGAFLGGVFK